MLQILKLNLSISVNVFVHGEMYESLDTDHIPINCLMYITICIDLCCDLNSNIDYPRNLASI